MPLPIILGIAAVAAGLRIIHGGDSDEETSSSSSGDDNSFDSGYPNNSHSTDVQAEWDGTTSE